MSTSQAPDPDEIVTIVAQAFEHVQVPPGPGAQETTDWLKLAEGSHFQARNAWRRLATRCERLTLHQRLAVGGMSLSAIAAMVLMVLAFNSGSRLSAMDRMAKHLREITSYSYRESWQSTWTEDEGKLSITSQGNGTADWMAPDAFCCEMKIAKTEQVIPDGKRSEQLLEHFAEIYPAGRPGVFIDYKWKTFGRVNFEPTGSRTYPSDLLRMIQEGSGKVTRDLGTKEIQGKKARGYAIVLQGSHERRESEQVRDPVEVWVDPATDLPLEFGYEGTNESKYWHRATDFRWNLTLDPQRFEPTPPAGYVDITPPNDESELEKIAAALKLYAEISGGHYPRVKSFDAAEVRGEMLKLKGFIGPAQSTWADNDTYRQIQQSAAGLDWISKILRNRFHAGYDGQKVGAADKDKILLWWTLWSPERHLVFYGDLRTEILSEAQWEKLQAAGATPKAIDEN